MNIFFGRNLGGKAELGRQLPALILVHLLNRFCTSLYYINLAPGSGDLVNAIVCLLKFPLHTFGSALSVLWQHLDKHKI